MARLSGFEAFQMHRALKLHFTDKYDYQKYSGRVGNRKQYEKSSGRRFFDKVAKSYEPRELERFFIANMLINPNVWIKDMIGDEGHQNYLQWCKRNLTITERFKEDLLRIKKLCDNESISYNEVFVAPEREHPPIIEMVINSTIDLETFVVLDDIMKITPFLNRDLAGDPIWDTMRDKVWRYRGFVSYDRNKMYEIAKTIF